MVLTDVCTRWVTLLSLVTCCCSWSCRLSTTISTSLILSKRTINQPMTRLTTPKTSLFPCETLARMVLTKLRESGVSLGSWNTSLRIRAWFFTLLVIPILGGWNTSWWRGWSWKLLMNLRGSSTTQFLLEIFIVPSPTLLNLLYMFPKLITLNMLSMSH